MGRVQLHGDTEELLATHRIVVGVRKQAESLGHVHSVVSASYTGRHATLLVTLNGRSLQDLAWRVGPVTLEELVLGYMTSRADPPTAAPLGVIEELSA